MDKVKVFRTEDNNAMIELRLQGVTHRLLVKEASQLVNRLREAVDTAVMGDGGIWCPKCGRFLCAKFGRPGLRYTDCDCGNRVFYTERGWLESDISVETSVSRENETTYRIAFDPVDLCEISGHVYMDESEVKEFIVALKWVLDTSESYECDRYCIVKDYTLSGARKYVLTFKKAKSVFDTLYLHRTIRMTRADVFGLYKTLENVLGKYAI